jgi:hypothetical protein
MAYIPPQLFYPLMIPVAGDYVNQALSRKFPLPNYQKPEITPMLLNMIGRQAQFRRTLPNKIYYPVGKLRLQMTFGQLENILVTARLMKTQKRFPVLTGMKRKLHLVAIIKNLVSPHDRLHRRNLDFSDMVKRLLKLILLVFFLDGVFEILPFTPATITKMLAGWSNPETRWFQKVFYPPFGKPGSGTENPHLRDISRHPPFDKNHVPV